jgi:hypothetical protein
VYEDRLSVPTPDTICGQDFAIGAGAGVLGVFGDVRIADTPDGEYVVAAAMLLTDAGAGPVLATALCIYQSPPINGAPRLDLAVPPDRVPLQVRAAELDGDPCPEVVAELGDLYGTLRYAQFWNPNGDACDVVAEGLIADGHLLGAGDLDGDGRDEVLVDRFAMGDVLDGVADVVPGLVLPEGLDAAVVGDVNRDGRADIAAITTEARDLTIVLRVDAGYAPRTVASAGALREVVTGDFDGDTYADVAAIEAPAADLERVVVAFGGPTGPQGFDSIGRIGGAHALVAHVDGVPAVSSDAFADLLLIDDLAEGGQEIAQFNGSSTRALTSEIDLTGPPPTGDNNTTFGRTVAGGELVVPRDGLDDFCVVSYGLEPGPIGVESFARAFCVGGEGTVLAVDRLVDAGGFSANGDLIEANEALPLLAAADVASTTGGEPVSVLVALRRDQYVAPELIVMSPPLPEGLPSESITTVRLADRFPLPVLPPGFEHVVIINGMRALQLDDDVDSELIVSMYDVGYDPADGSTVSVSSLLYRVDLSRAGNGVDAVATTMVEGADRACSDAVRLELGDTTPEGTTTAPGPELVALCTDYLHAWYRGADGTELGPFAIGSSDGAFGPIAAGDLTGDRLDDLAMLVGEDRDAFLLVMPQCPAHDTSACATSIGVDDR